MSRYRLLPAPAQEAQRPGQGRAEPGILASGWGLLVRRLRDKAPGRVGKINPVPVHCLRFRRPR